MFHSHCIPGASQHGGAKRGGSSARVAGDIMRHAQAHARASALAAWVLASPWPCALWVLSRHPWPCAFSVRSRVRLGSKRAPQPGPCAFWVRTRQPLRSPCAGWVLVAPVWAVCVLGPVRFGFEAVCVLGPNVRAAWAVCILGPNA